ncbi:MAG TPA: helix-hairpin-helix domain-containing protein [Patescibacteria group bacterium]|nr:helix-hairpin-helix domain-containing protein [Patescibacteria group bacterium]
MPLIFLAGFLVFPNISLANNFDDITLREIGKHLELPGNKVQDLLHSLINIFHSEWIDLLGSGYVTAEKMAVPSIMKKAVQVQALNHLLTDAPIETTWTIVKNATKIARVILIQDPSGVLNELEKESVKKAIGYGMSVLLENEIRMSPGAIEFEYKLREGGKGKVLIQYLMIYKPFDNKNGEMIIRFYSTESLKPPKNESSIGSKLGTYTELERNLPPFIVDIRGTVEDYKWIGNPSIDIDFPPEVPDLGIKPLSWWEKYLLKPIESTIKDVEIVITKVTGTSFGLTDIWGEIKSFISQITSFSPAALIETGNRETNEIWHLGTANILDILSPRTEELFLEESIKMENTEDRLPTELPTETKSEISLEELQEMLDDIAESIDILTQKFAELIEAKEQETEEEIEDEEILDEDSDEKWDDVCFGNININTASKEELQKIAGVGPVLAQRIINNRPFYSIYDLIKVSGIGEITLQKIINQGCAYVENDRGPTAVVGSSSSSPSPQITLNYSAENPVNKEIETELSVFNLKNAVYDMKISIEKDGVLSEIYDEKQDKWQSSQYYLKEFFSGISFSGNFKLKIKDSENSFKGEADILAKVRETGKSSYLEFRGKINITEPEQATSTPVAGLKVLINEIQIDGIEGPGGAKDDWVELYNPNNQDIPLSGWSIQRHTYNGGILEKKNFESGHVIPAQGYFLIVRNEANDNLKIIADMTCSALQLSSSSTVYLVNNNEAIKDGDDSNIVDKVGIGDSSFFPEGNPAPNPPEAKSIERKELGLDTDDNFQDFAINENPSPTNSKGEAGPTFLTNYQIIEDTTFTLQGSPYIVQGMLIISESETLTVEPGITLKFKENSGIEVNGTLKASGQENKKIVFTSFNKSNYWRGIYFSALSSDSELNWTEISYAWGSEWQGYPAILIEDTSIILQNSTITNYTNRGLKLINSSSIIEKVNFLGGGVDVSIDGITIERGSPTIKNCSINNNKQGIFVEVLDEGDLPTIEGNNFKGNERPVYASVSNIVFRDNQGENNQINGILLFGYISQNLNWHKNGLPYIIGNPISGSALTVNVGTVLTVEPGVRVELGNSSSLEVNGTVISQGTISEPIIFTAYPGGIIYGNQAPWRRIYFSASSTNSKLENTIVSQGGYYSAYHQGSIWVKESVVEFENLSCIDNPNAICLHLENSSSTVKNSRFEGNKIGLKIQGSAIPILENNQFTNNTECDIYWPGGGDNCQKIATSSPSLTVECGCCPY